MLKFANDTFYLAFLLNILDIPINKIAQLIFKNLK